MSSNANNVSSLNHNMASLSVNGNTMSSSNGDNASSSFNINAFSSSNVNNASSSSTVNNNPYSNRNTPSILTNGVWYYPADPSIDIHMFGFYYLPDPGNPYYRDVA